VDSPRTDAQKAEPQAQEAQKPAADMRNADKPAGQKEEKKNASEQAIAAAEPGK